MNTPTPSPHSGEQGKPSDVLRTAIEALQTIVQTPTNGKVAAIFMRTHASLTLDAIKARELERSEALERKHEQSEPVVRDREADRKRFPDPAFNEWLDVGISDSGHTVWCSITNIEEAWAGWSNRPYYAPPPSDQAVISDEVVQKFRGIILASGSNAWASTDAVREALDWYESAFPRGVGSWPKARVAHACAVHACDTCEGTGLANVADYDGALVIDDCPECGGESRTARPAPEAQAEKPVAWMLLNKATGQLYWDSESCVFGSASDANDEADILNDDGNEDDFIAVALGFFRPQPSASETPSAVDVSLLAYEAGWMACAEWAERDDLPADTGSYAYCCERDSRLAAIAAQTGVCAHCGRPAGGHTLACSSIRAEAIAAQRKEGES